MLRLPYNVLHIVHQRAPLMYDQLRLKQTKKKTAEYRWCSKCMPIHIISLYNYINR